VDGLSRAAARGRVLGLWMSGVEGGEGKGKRQRGRGRTVGALDFGGRESDEPAVRKKKEKKRRDWTVDTGAAASRRTCLAEDGQRGQPSAAGVDSILNGRLSCASLLANDTVVS
jgi:hypothetical protein